MAAYGKNMSNTDEIINQLIEIDVSCGESDVSAEILILGGAALAILLEQYDSSFRSTKDIDIEILSTPNREIFESILRRYEVDIISGIVEVPPQEDFSVGEKFEVNKEGFKNLKVFVPKIELLACTKIFSKRGKDLQDLTETDLLLHCDKDTLRKLVDEYKDYTLMLGSPDLNYHQFDRILEEKGI